MCVDIPARHKISQKEKWNHIHKLTPFLPPYVCVKITFSTSCFVNQMGKHEEKHGYRKQFLQIRTQ